MATRAQVGGDLAGEGVVAKVQVTKPPETAQARRDVAVQPVESQLERSQEREVPDGRGERPGKPLPPQAFKSLSSSSYQRG